jgi:hypothetical protein
MLRAALASDERTKHLNILFKGGDNVDLDLLLDDLDVLIHDRWLDFYASHDRHPCSLSRQASSKDYNTETFTCDYIVNYLYGLLLDQLMPGSIYVGETGTKGTLCAKVEQNLKEMPRKLEIVLGSQPQEIKVSWVDIAGAVNSLYGLDLECRITLHLENNICRKYEEELLAPES